MIRLVILAMCATATAHADGYYFDESFGLSTTRGSARSALDSSLHLKLGVGMRIGAVSIEPWVSSDLSWDRDDATFGVFAGTPAPGHADLVAVGIDAKYTAPLSHHLGIYVRGGPRFASGSTALDGYYGSGIGVGTGIELVGQVNAFGYLWAPLFLLKRGPKVHGALFLDQGLDLYRLQAAHAPSLGAAIASTSIGFSIGTDF